MIYVGITIFTLIILRYSAVYKNKKAFCFLLGLSFCLLPLFRVTRIELDVYRYVYKYVSFPGYTYSDVVLRETKDTGFYIIAKFLADIGCPTNLWLFLIGLAFSIGCYVLIYNYSEMPLLSYFMILAFYFAFTLTGLRQTVALGCIMVATKCMLDRKLKPFLFFVLLASVFHSTAIIFLPAYWISKWKIGIKHLFLVLGSIVLSVSFSSLLRSYIARYAWESLQRYGYREQGLSWSGFIIQAAILLFCVYSYNSSEQNKEDPLFNTVLNCMVIGLCVQSFATAIAEAFRLSYYYSLCSIIAVPHAINNTKNVRFESRRLLALIIVGVLLIYIVTGNRYSELLPFSFM